MLVLETRLYRFWKIIKFTLLLHTQIKITLGQREITVGRKLDLHEANTELFFSSPARSDS